VDFLEVRLVCGVKDRNKSIYLFPGEMPTGLPWQPWVRAIEPAVTGLNGYHASTQRRRLARDPLQYLAVISPGEQRGEDGDPHPVLPHFRSSLVGALRRLPHVLDNACFTLRTSLGAARAEAMMTATQQLF
jgi:hypothetical protein